MDPSRLIDDLRDRLPAERFSFRFARSAGPGGQNVNKVSTRAILSFDLDGCETLSAHEKRRIRGKLGRRVTKDGHIRVVSMRHRTQRANRRAAVERFYELLGGALARRKPRKPTSVPRFARKRRLSDKRHLGRRKQQRSAPLMDE